MHARVTPVLSGASALPKPSVWRDYALLTLGSLLIAVGVYFFKFPNHF